MADSKDNKEPQHKVKCRLLFLSKTTYDKRATENTLLGEKLFDVNSTKVEVEKQEKGDIIIDDTPAIMDTDAEAKLVKDVIEKHRKKSNKYNAVVLVFRYPVRMTPEEQASIKIMVDVIGKGYIEKYGILIFTNGISFLQEEDSDQAFSNYLQDEIEIRKKSTNENSFHCFGELIELITTDRCMFIHNEENDDGKREMYRQQFVGIVDKITKEQKGDLYKGKPLGIFPGLKFDK